MQKRKVAPGKKLDHVNSPEEENGAENDINANSNETEYNKTKKKGFERRLLKYKELPEYLQDNEFILDYYRCEWPLKDVIFSIFSWHNETLNIWTHLGGFLIFVGLMVISAMGTMELGGLISGFSRGQVSWPLMMTTTKSDMNVSDSNLFPDSHELRHISQPSSVFNVHKEDEAIPRWPWFVFLSGAMACLVCSSLSHLLACHSKRFNLFFWRLDYAGISLMIISSFFAPIYYAFYCHHYARIFYLTSITILGILAIITLLAPALSAPCFRSFRASLFLAMGFSGVIPAAHAVILHWGNSLVFVALGYELVMGVFYAVGAGFYITRVPERWKPGAFDIAGHSHQIFHVFVVFGALAHCVATLAILDFRRGSPNCMC